MSAFFVYFSIAFVPPGTPSLNTGHKQPCRQSLLHKHLATYPATANGMLYRCKLYGRHALFFEINTYLCSRLRILFEHILITGGSYKCCLEQRTHLTWAVPHHRLHSFCLKTLAQQAAKYAAEHDLPRLYAGQNAQNGPSQRIAATLVSINKYEQKNITSLFRIIHQPVRHGSTGRPASGSANGQGFSSEARLGPACFAKGCQHHGLQQRATSTLLITSLMPATTTDLSLFRATTGLRVSWDIQTEAPLTSKTCRRTCARFCKHTQMKSSG